MSIEPFNKNILSSAVVPASSVDKVGQVNRLPDKDKADLFSRILDGLVAEKSVLSQEQPNNEKPLDRDKVLQLIQWMNIKMNESLLRSVGGDGFDSSYRWKIDTLASTLTTAKPVETESSEVESIPALPKAALMMSKNNYEAIIQKAAAAYDVDPDLIRGVIQVESSFNASAQSPKGAMGLMQLMPGTARELGVANPYDPEENVMGGTRYLKKLLNRYDGNVSLALAAYNWGMGNLENHRNWMPQETRNYVSRITSLYNRSEARTS